MFIIIARTFPQCHQTGKKIIQASLTVVVSLVVRMTYKRWFWRKASMTGHKYFESDMTVNVLVCWCAAYEQGCPCCTHTLTNGLAGWNWHLISSSKHPRPSKTESVCDRFFNMRHLGRFYERKFTSESSRVSLEVRQKMTLSALLKKEKLKWKK